MIFCISLTELCGFSFFSCIFKVDKNILFSFFEEHRDFEVRFTWIFCHCSSAQKRTHSQNSSWIWALSGGSLFPKSRAPLQDAQDLSTVLRSVLIQDTFSWLVKQCLHAHAVFEIELSIQPSRPGHCVWDIPWSPQTDLDNRYLRSLERNVHSALCPAWLSPEGDVLFFHRNRCLIRSLLRDLSRWFRKVEIIIELTL